MIGDSRDFNVFPRVPALLKNVPGRPDWTIVATSHRMTWAAVIDARSGKTEIVARVSVRTASHLVSRAYGSRSPSDMTAAMVVPWHDCRLVFLRGAKKRTPLGPVALPIRSMREPQSL